MAAIGLTLPLIQSLKLDSTIGAMVPNASGFIYTYEAGTSTPLDTFTDSSLLVPNTNPIQLDANGQCTMYLSPTPALKIDVQDSDGVSLPGFPVDDISPAAVAS